MGGIDFQLEEILSKGAKLVQCENIEMLKKRERARVTLIPIEYFEKEVFSLFLF